LDKKPLFSGFEAFAVGRFHAGKEKIIQIGEKKFYFFLK